MLYANADTDMCTRMMVQFNKVVCSQRTIYRLKQSTAHGMTLSHINVNNMSSCIIDIIEPKLLKAQV